MLYRTETTQFVLSIDEKLSSERNSKTSTLPFLAVDGKINREKFVLTDMYVLTHISIQVAYILHICIYVEAWSDLLLFCVFHYSHVKKIRELSFPFPWSPLRNGQMD
jgi:hypothetical protein